MVAAASYPARVYGIRSAMSMAQALRLCPQLVVVTPQRSGYSETSGADHADLADFTPVIEPLSLDEAFLDVSGAVGLFGRPADIARQIRQRIHAEQQLTCSVGVAPIKSVAKLASGSCKPNGLRVVSAAGVLDFLHPLPVTALWGVGARTAEPLRRLGIRTVGELAATPLDTLRRAVGSATAAASARSGERPGRSRSHRPGGGEVDLHRPDTGPRSADRGGGGQGAAAGAGEVAERLRHAGRVARTVGIKIRFADFTTVTRVRTLAEPTDAAATVYAEALQLYRALGLDKPRIRLVGVKAENLRPAGEATQLALDLTGSARTAPTPDQAIDALVARYGESVVRPASLLGPAVEPGAGGRNGPELGPRVVGGRRQITNRGNLPSNPTS